MKVFFARRLSSFVVALFAMGVHMKTAGCTQELCHSGTGETPVLVRLCAYLIREVQVLSRYTFSGL
jgi:hypothetical protein